MHKFENHCLLSKGNLAGKAGLRPLDPEKKKKQKKPPFLLLPKSEPTC